MIDGEPIAPLAAYQRGEKTRREMAAELGISVQWLRKLMAKERERGIDPVVDADELPHLALTDDPARERGHWYDLESGAASVDRGRVRVGNHSGTKLLVRSINGGQIQQQDDSEPKSEGRAVNDSDRAAGVVFVQQAG